MKSSFTRSAFVERAARNLLGVSALTGLPALPQFARGGKAAEFVDNTKLPGFGSAENCIYLFMAGGMSHLDTFDPKQGSEIMGTTGTLKTKIPGEPLANNLPELAKLRYKFAIVRSLGQKTGYHIQGSYLMRTSYSDRPDIRPIGARNFAVIGQFCEQPRDCVFTVEYSIRSARTAVAGLTGRVDPPPPVARTDLDPMVLIRAARVLMGM